MSKPLTRQQMWRKLNPKKYNAHKDVANALRRGEITREPCEVCGAKRVDAHHGNYNYPLDVQWLCRRHHIQIHKIMGAI